LQVEDRQIQQPFGDRSGVVIEPRLKNQWYVDAEKLAVPAIDAVEKGETKFVPANWSKTYFEWMRNIQPWCVSRQLWWGHRIPAWFGLPLDRETGREIDAPLEAFVAETEDEAKLLAEEYYGPKVDVELIDDGFLGLDTFEDVVKRATLVRDPDVLDTWFSSALWPFATLGWPDETPELARYYQTDVLVTGFDIIFFWVARMMMMGLHFMEEPPFHTVYMHALVRDEHGQKMSKSKGNVIDPLSLIDEFGADALRFTLTAMAAQGRDIKLSKQRVEGYRNFSTKLWNAARFCEMNECAPSPGFDPASAARPLDRWIIGQTVQCQIDVTRHLEAYRFNEAAGALYQFIWGVFCDWHLELIKPVLNEGDEQAQAATRRTTGWALEQILRMLHPFMPFVTEELWGALGEGGAPRDGMLAACVWPSHPDELIDPAARDEVGWVIGLITEIRSLKAEMGLSAVRAPMALVGAAPENAERLERYRDIVMRMAGLDQARASDAVPSGAVQTVHGEATVALPLAGLVDLEAEVARLQKEAAKVDGDIAKIEAKLANEKFLARAPEAVVQEQRDRRADAAAKADKLREAIDRFRSAM
ncbi:MAG: class I tRNA ligase family protein, partial [Pseudomonadota bacterium]